MKLLILLFVTIPVGLFESFVALSGWRWFAVESGLSDKPLNLFIMWGFTLLINMLFKSRTNEGLEEESDIEDILKGCLYSVIYSLVAWGLMAAAHAFAF